MAISQPSDLNSKNLPAGDGDGYFYDGKLAATPAANTDTLRFLRIPAGTRLVNVDVRIKTAFAGSWGGAWKLTACDGASDAIIGATGTTTTLQAAVGPVTAGLYQLNFEPVTTKVDTYLDLVLTSGTGLTAGEATAVASGMGYGSR